MAGDQWYPSEESRLGILIDKLLIKETVRNAYKQVLRTVVIRRYFIYIARISGKDYSGKSGRTSFLGSQVTSPVSGLKVM